MNLKELHADRKRVSLNIAKLDEEITALKKERDILDAKILEMLQEQGLDYAVIDGKRYEVRSQIVFSATDWEQVWAWVMANEAPYILQKRLSQKTIETLTEGGELPDGVEQNELTKLRVVNK